MTLKIGNEKGDSELSSVARQEEGGNLWDRPKWWLDAYISDTGFSQVARTFRLA